ncbi:MAG TPA: hypothetical protein VFC16_05195 [Nakamurella sp.]|nr:hypothetical protein [Nakamurella sp.]
MNRRGLLLAVGAGVLGVLAGCGFTDGGPGMTVPGPPGTPVLQATAVRVATGWVLARWRCRS